MGKRILIVDDESDIISLLAIRLKAVGYQALGAVSLLPQMQGDEECK